MQFALLHLQPVREARLGPGALQLPPLGANTLGLPKLPGLPVEGAPRGASCPVLVGGVYSCVLVTRVLKFRIISHRIVYLSGREKGLAAQS